MKKTTAQEKVTEQMHFLKKAHVTEKSGVKSEKENVYTFQVQKDATKKNIAAEIARIYKVTPIGVNIVNLPAKAVVRRGKRGKKQAVKKALVFLKKGDKIAFM